MIKRVPFVAVGFLSLCLPLAAQQPSPRDVFKALNTSSLCLASLTLADAGPFSYAGPSNWTDLAAADFLPALPTATTSPAPRRTERVYATAMPDSSKEPVSMVRRHFFDYAGGEVGFLYGHSSGKYSRDVESAYIIGEAGNDKINITVGASYENVSGQVPRWGR